MTLALTLSSRPVMRRYSEPARSVAWSSRRVLVHSSLTYVWCLENPAHWQVDPVTFATDVIGSFSCLVLDWTALVPAQWQFYHCCCLEEVVAVWSSVQFSIGTHAPHYILQFAHIYLYLHMWMKCLHCQSLNVSSIAESLYGVTIIITGSASR